MKHPIGWISFLKFQLWRCFFKVKFSILKILYTLGGEHILKTCSSKTLILDHGVFFPLCRLFDITWVASHYGYQERTYQVIGIFPIAVYVAPKDSLSFRYAQAFLLLLILYFNSLIYSFQVFQYFGRNCNKAMGSKRLK